MRALKERAARVAGAGRAVLDVMARIENGVDTDEWDAAAAELELAIQALGAS